MQVKDLIVTGDAKILGNLYTKDGKVGEDDDSSVPYTYGTTDLTAGSSSLATGKLYFVYE